ncbi:MAG TPA: hypothetical protein VN794_05645 [Methylomirabilota bacterium]|jgi:hypothetical protein|nr:hypothetical protein [Methylomirabilota bacterium]
MTKLIAALIIVAALYGGWHLFLYWDKVRNEEQTAQKQAVASTVDPRQLPGMPQQLESALDAAEKQGAAGLKNFLKTYDRSLQDPRKAWIELDYVQRLARDEPVEAKRRFAEIRDRVGPASPVWPRIKQLEKTYE